MELPKFSLHESWICTILIKDLSPALNLADAHRNWSQIYIYVKIVLFFTPCTALKQLRFQICSQKSFLFTFSLTHAHLDLSLKKN